MWSLGSAPVFRMSVLSGMLLPGLLLMVVKAVYIQMMLQCLLVWTAFIRCLFADPKKNKNKHNAEMVKKKKKMTVR